MTFAVDILTSRIFLLFHADSLVFCCICPFQCHPLKVLMYVCNMFVLFPCWFGDTNQDLDSRPNESHHMKTIRKNTYGR